MIELKVERLKYADKQVVGIMKVYQGSEFVVCFAILEPPDRNNEIGKSCIPKGSYAVKHYSSKKYPNAFILQDTGVRTMILIHSGNYYTHSQGCLLIGTTHKDINKDGYIDVASSVAALKRLNTICKNESILNITIE